MKTVQPFLVWFVLFVVVLVVAVWYTANVDCWVGLRGACK